MQKKTKRKLFVILMALTLIVTLMPTMAFAEGEAPTATLKVNVNMVGENSEPIEKDAAEVAVLKLEKLPLPKPQTLDSDTHPEGDSSILLKKVGYEDNKASVDFGEVSTSYRYRLTEETAPTGYFKSKNEYVVCFVEKEGNYLIRYLDDSEEVHEFKDIPEEGLLFEHEKKAEVSIPIEKIVTGDAAPDETFTAKLSVYREHVSEVSASDETGTTPILTETTSFKKGEETLTFYVDGTILDGAMLYLEEVNDGKTGWTYDSQVYLVEHGIPESEIIAHMATILSGEELDPKNVYGKLTKVEKIGVNPGATEGVLDKATFTNTYTKPYSGGSSTTRYYNVKVNNGKALSITGAELSRVVAGTTINAVADPAAEGKVFKGWEVVKGGITVGEADRFTFAMPHEDVEITAVYEDKAEPVTPADPGDSEDPTEPDDVDVQPDDYDGPVPKTGDAQAAELAIFAALMLMAAFGLKKVYNR